MPNVTGTAVLRDYPLRLWLRQQEHTDAVLREFSLLLGGHESGTTDTSPPQQLLDLAEMVTTRFGALVTSISDARQRALDAGLDRMDSEVPLFEGIRPLLEQIQTVMAAVDEYCDNGDLLTLARPPELAAFTDWTISELLTQDKGGEPTPWPGPF